MVQCVVRDNSDAAQNRAADIDPSVTQQLEWSCVSLAYKWMAQSLCNQRHIHCVEEKQQEAKDTDPCWMPRTTEWKAEVTPLKQSLLSSA